MSIGTFADRATRNHIKQTTKQKKVVFGERPLTISAQSLKVTNSFMNQSEMNASQSAIQTQSTTFGSQNEQNNKLKTPVVPYYIIPQDNSALHAFHIVMGILAVPSVILNLFFIAFGFDNFFTLRMCVELMEILFFIEIICHFFTAYKDPENFDSVYSLKKIAHNYLANESFIMHILAAFPYQLIWTYSASDPNENALRNILMFKLLRLARLSTDFIPDDTLLSLMQSFYRPESRDDKIANDRFIINVIKIVKQVLTTLVTTYFLGLLWYRFSDYWQKLLMQKEPESRYWVVYFGLRSENQDLFEYDYLSNVLQGEKRPGIYTKLDQSQEYVGGVGAAANATAAAADAAGRLLFGGKVFGIEKDLKYGTVTTRLVTCMYYALTTLSTVGYGDFYPKSIAEKILGSIIQIFGVTFFSILMNNFIDVVLSMKSSNFSNNEDTLQKWFSLIKKIKNQPHGGMKDIDPGLRDRIESHFRYFWDNDRTAVLLEKKEYFDSIPFKIQEHIMCKFLFQDIIDKAAFKSFFKMGREFDSNFVYEVAFGFMPRQFKDTPEDRYILMEEGDVTEIYFILKGEWAVAYNGYLTPSDAYSQIEDDESLGPDDMRREGRFIAYRHFNFGYIGDYYVLSSKRSQFFYVALSQVEAFALTKQFMFKTIFKKFPGLHSEMLAESFSRYIKEFRRPCGKKRTETLAKINKKLQYSQIMTDAQTRSQTRDINKALKQLNQNPNAGELRRINSRTKIFEKQEELRQYKEQLDVLNEKANTMFEHMKQINKLVNKKIMDIECAVTKSEAIFVDEINLLIKNKTELSKIERKSFVQKGT